MPTYAYACTACDHRFETVQAFTDSALTECPECSGQLRKLFNSVGIVFKGSGFYRTDSRDAAGGTKKSSSGSSESSGSADSSGTKDSSSKTDTAATTSGSSSSTSSSTSSTSGSSSSTASSSPAA